MTPPDLEVSVMIAVRVHPMQHGQRMQFELVWSKMEVSVERGAYYCREADPRAPLTECRGYIATMVCRVPFLGYLVVVEEERCCWAGFVYMYIHDGITF